MPEPTSLDPRIVDELRRIADASLDDFDADRIADRAASVDRRRPWRVLAVGAGLAGLAAAAVLAAVIGVTLRDRDVAAISPSPSSAVEPSGSPTPSEPVESPRPSAPGEAEVLARFLSRMADPEVTYRFTSLVELEPDRADGAPAAALRHTLDVRGDDYAGFLHVTGHLYQAVGMNDFIAVRVLDDVVQLREWRGPISEVPEPAGMTEANPFVALSSDDFVFIGLDAEGRAEFEVVPWLWGDVLHPYLGLGLAAGPDVGPMTILAHETRLSIDADGVPQRVTSEWTFTNGDDPRVLHGVLDAAFPWFGLYVVINPLDAPYPADSSSHEIELSEDVWGPWFQVDPTGPTARLTIVVEGEGSLPWGVEGAIDFLSATDADGAVALDRKVALRNTPAEIAIPTGEITLTPYTRTCGGHCSILDPPQVICAVDGSIAADGRYELRITAGDDGSAACRLEEVGG